MSILNDPLIQKYFSVHGEGESMSRRVLSSMEQPIKKGERYLACVLSGFIERVVGEQYELGERFKDSIHIEYLRLPDFFQPSLNHHHVWRCECGELSKIGEDGQPLPVTPREHEPFCWCGKVHVVKN